MTGAMLGALGGLVGGALGVVGYIVVRMQWEACQRRKAARR